MKQNNSNSLRVKTIVATIEQEIYNDFLEFVKEKNVYKNGFRTIHPKTAIGQLEIRIPRTRKKNENDENYNYLPDLSSTSLKDLVDKLLMSIVNMFKVGNSFKDIRAFLKLQYGFGISNNLLSKIYNSFYSQLLERKTRTLSEFYVALFYDAMYLKIKIEEKKGYFTIKNVPLYFVLGINSEGKKEILDFAIFPKGENKYDRLQVIQNIYNRGVKKVLLSISDGLPGLSEAIKIVFPETITQKCIVHKIRNLLDVIHYSDEKKFLSDLKKVYNAPSKQIALNLLEQMKEKWKKYDYYLKSRLYDFDERSNYFDFPRPIRKIIYTTNIIENLNSLVRRELKGKRVFFTVKSAEISIFLIVQKINFNKSLKTIFNRKKIKMYLFELFPAYQKYLL